MDYCRNGTDYNVGGGVAMAHTRVYIEILSGVVATPTAQQWSDLFTQAKTYPLATAILNAARLPHNRITNKKHAIGAGHELKRTIVGFEVDARDIAAITTVVNAEAGSRSITGTLPEKFMGVLEAELQDAATDLGYGAQADQLTINWYTFGDRGAAISAAQTYIATNTAIWHEAL